MRTVLSIAGILLLMGLMALSSLAQDAPAPELCDLNTTLDEPLGLRGAQDTNRTVFTSLETTMNEAITAGDAKLYLDAFRTWKVFMSAFDAKCRGLSWSGQTEGKEVVIGPVSFPDGFWRAHWRSMGPYASANVTVIEGTCDGPIILFSGTGGEGQMGEWKEAVFETEGCLALIEVAATGSEADWELFFELVVAKNP